MKIAYEHIRKAPEGQLANELMSRTLEEEICAPTTPSEENRITLAGKDVVSSDSEAHNDIELPPPMQQGIKTVMNDLSTEAPTEHSVQGRKDGDSTWQDAFDEEGSGDEKSNDFVDTQNSLLSSKTGCPEKDIGDKNISTEEFIADLKSDEQVVLQKAYEVVGPAQVTRKKWNALQHGYWTQH